MKGTRTGVIAAVWVFVALVVCGFGRAAAADVTLRVAPEHRRWSYETYRETRDIQQSYVPIDLEWRARPSLVASFGVDLVSSKIETDANDGNLDGLGDFRAGVRSSFGGDRFFLAAGLRVSLYDDALTPREARLAEAIEPFQLEFPVLRAGTGTRASLVGGWQLLRSARVQGSVGAVLELRDSYTLREDGLELDPGELVRLGTRWDALFGSVRAGASLFASASGTYDLGGRPGFAVGDWIEMQLDADVPVGGRSVRVALELLSVGAGEVETDVPLATQSLRGGNRVRWEASTPIVSGPLFLRGALGGTHVRGFAGALGHADWITPRLTAGRSFEPGTVELELDLSTGQVREGRDLSGVGVRLSWVGRLGW